MPLFLGKFPYVIDEKGRVNVPARFREQMSKETDSTLAIFKGMDGCIFVYPQSTLDTFRSNFDKSQFRQIKNARLLQRLMADGGATGVPDGQGRITLSPEQREHADLKRDVIIFGNFDRIEIWNPDRLATHLANAGSQGLDMDDLAGAFFGEPGATPPEQGR